MSGYIRNAGDRHVSYLRRQGLSQQENKLTRDNISSIHCILIFYKAEAIHKLDLGNLPRAMAAEMLLDILFGHCKQITMAPS